MDQVYLNLKPNIMFDGEISVLFPRESGMWQEIFVPPSLFDDILWYIQE